MNSKLDFVDLKINREPFLHLLNECRKAEKFTDVKLQMGDKLFPAHQNVLSLYSPVLEALISDQWSTTKICQLSDQYVDSEIMEDLLSFFYTGKIKLTPDNVHSVCVAIHFLQIPNLLEPSVEYLCQFITMENVFTLFKFATACELEELNYHCCKFVNNNHEVVFQCSEILELSFKNFKDLIVGLKKFWANMLRENTFHCVVRWTERHPSGRSDDFPILLKNIPLKELSLKFLIKTVLPYLLEKNSISGIETVSAAMANYRTHSNNDLQTNQNLIVFGEINRVGGLPWSDGYKKVYTMNYYDSHTGIWKQLLDVLSYRSHFAATIMNQQDIIICGGLGEPFEYPNTTSIDMFDWSQQTWSKLSELPCRTTSKVSIAICKGDLYVLGAEKWEGDMFSRKVLRYFFQTKQWKYVKSMKEERHGGLILEHKNHLYVFGGGANTAERYDPNCDKWTWMKDMLNQDVYAATSHQDKIYVYGDEILEEYDPKTDTWSSLPAPPVRRSSLVSLTGKLLMVGGIDRKAEWYYSSNSDEEITDSVYEFNYSTQEWIEFTKMNAVFMNTSSVSGAFY